MANEILLMFLKIKPKFIIVFSILSLLFSVFVLFFEIIPVWYNLFNLFVSEKIFNQEILNNIIEDSIFIHSRVLNVGLLLLFIAIIKRKMGAIDFGVILFLSFYTKMYEFMDQKIHPFLVENGFFNYLLKTTANQFNPQYTRLSIFSLLILILLLLIVIKKTRTIDRSFIFLICSSILTTTILFHFAIPMGMLRYAKHEKMESFISEARKNNELNFCSNRTCMFLYDDFTEIEGSFIGERKLLEDNKQFIEESKSFFNKKENQIFPIYGISGNFLGTYSIFKVCIKKEYGYFCSLDNNLLKKYGYYSELWFSFLTSVAHAFWIFFGVLLLMLHKLKVVRYLVENKNGGNKVKLIKVDLENKDNS